MFKILRILLLMFIISCNIDNECTKILPDRTVNININKQLPDFTNKLDTEGYLIVETQGIKGVIIYKSAYGYKAYDLASPHLSIDNENSKLEITDDNWHLENKNDGALFLLETGQPRNDISRCALKEYRVYNRSNEIIVTNF